MKRQFRIAMLLVCGLTCALASGSAADWEQDESSLKLFENSGRTISRDAFSMGSVLYVRASQLDSRCWRIVWKDPTGTPVRTDYLPGTSSTRDIAFTVPAAGPSGTWTAELQQGNQNPGGSNPCSATTSYTTRQTGRFDVARIVVVGAVEAGGVGGDGWIEQQSSGTVPDGGTGSVLYVKSEKSKNKRVFVRFNLSSAGLPGSIGAARVRMFMSVAPTSSRTYEIRRVTGPWLESSLRWSNRPAVAGGITDARATGTSDDQPIYWLVGSDVAGFSSGSLTNYGWEIRDAAEDYAYGNRKGTFSSTEASSLDKTKWPVLLVDYDGSPVCSTGGPYTSTCRTASVGGATALDPEGDALTYSWSSNNPSVTVSPAGGAIAAGSGTRAVPPATATLAGGVAPSGQSAVLTLTIGDGHGNSATATAAVTFNDNINPQITAPANVNASTSDDGPGNCSTAVILGLPTVSDNCTLPVRIAVTNNAPATFPGGQTIVTWTATDEAGNRSTATQTVNVIDSEDPALGGMPAGITVGTGPGATTASVAVSWTAPVASDNCPGVTLSANHAPGESFPVGVTTVTYTATDAAGHATSRSFTVTVTDNTKPVLTVGANRTVPTDGGQCAALVGALGTTASDNAPGVTLVGVRSDGAALGAAFPAGVTTIAWTATDAAGNTASATQTVTVNDVESPTLSGMPAAVALSTGPGATTASAAASWTAPLASDNCPGVTLSANHAPGESFPLGATTVTYTATDAAGHATSRSFTVTVTDNTKPVLTMGANRTVPTDGGQCAALVGALGTSASDNAPGVSLVGVRSDGAALGAAFPAGVTTIAWTATDAAGNTATATQTVTVNDTESPALSGIPGALVLGTGLGATTASVAASWTAPVASDNCPGVVLSANHAPGESFPVGVTTVTYTATDAAGRATSRSFAVTVTDNTKPVLVMGANRTVPTDGGQCAAIVGALGTSASDNAPGVSLVGVRSDGGALGDAFPAGVTTIAWTATDVAGNTATATQTVTVNDTESPALSSMPGALALGTGPGATTASVVASWTAPVASDNCPGVVLSANHAPGESFPVGVTTVTYTATDAAGHATSRSFAVAVNDNTKPVLAVGANRTVPTDAGQCAAIVGALGTSASDNAPGVSLVGVRSDGGALGDAFPAGVTTIAWTATDVAGNTATATQTVTVNDVESPALSGMPAALAIGTGSGATTASWTAPVASDNCPGVTLSANHAPGESLPLGVTTITYVATDAAGNSASQSFTVTVTDDGRPVIVAPDMAVPTDLGQCAAHIAVLGASASDNAPGVTLVGVRSDGAALGAAFPAGVTTIAWTATDAAGNTTTVTQTVTVNDTESPALSGIPAALVFSTGPEASATASWTAPEASDNCPGVTLSSNHAPGERLPLGVTTIIYTATDAAGNTASESFTVTVTDDTRPVIVAPDLVVPTDAGQCAAHVAALGASATDNEAGVTLAGVRSDGGALGDAYPAGATTIVWTATDVTGNTASATQTVTVKDLEKPTLSGMPDALELGTGSDATTANATASWTAPVASDNCPGVTLSANHAPGESFPLGATTITYTATDVAGNTTSQSFTVTVTDDTQPVVVAPDMAVPTDNGQCAAHVTVLGASASDNAPGVRLVGVRSDGAALGDPFPGGANPIAWIATDAAGNTETVIQTVMVNDMEKPVIARGASLSVATDAGLATARIAGLGTSASDNCPGVALVGTRSDGGALGAPFPIGVTTVSWRATDWFGNQSNALQTVMVADREKPVIVLGANATVPNDAGQCAAHIASLGTTASDNAPGVTLTGVRSDGGALGDAFAGGVTTIAWTATDASGNAATAVQTVAVNDVDGPALSGMPAAMDFSTGPDATTSSVMASWAAPLASDNCPGVVLSANHAPGESFPVGVTTVTYTATDAAGHATRRSFTVTVTDDTEPVLSVGADVTIPTDAGRCSAAAPALGTTATDNAPGMTLVGVRGDGAALGDPFLAGATPIAWIATDAAGNTVTATQTVIVNDMERPVIAPAAGISVQPDAGLSTARVTVLGPAAGDNCPGVTLVGRRSDGVPLDQPFPTGVTTITWTAMDGNGNRTTTTQTVRVADRQAPVIALGANLTVPTDAGRCAARVGALGTTATDNLPGVTLAGTRSDGAALGDPFPAGATTITWTALDADGNSSTAVQTVNVNDVEGPALSGMPANLVLGTGPGATTASAVASWTVPVASDNCPGVALSSNHQPGESFPLGTTTVSCTATDAAGHAITRSFTVTVTDDTKPVLTTADLTVPTSAGQCAASVAALGTSAHDNASGVTLVGVRGDGRALSDPFPGGATAIAWTAADAVGNTSTAIQTVRVNDAESPALSGMPDDVELFTGPEATTASVEAGWTAPLASDNCPGVTLSSNHNSGESFSVGATTVTYTATDAAGNVTRRSFKVTVVDDTPPVLAVADLTVPTDDDACQAIVASLGAVASDNAPGVRLVAIRGDGARLSDPFLRGATPISWMATDAAGNTTTSIQTVFVNDTESPALMVPPAVRVTTGVGATTAIVIVPDLQLGTALASDNCSGARLTRSGVPAGNRFPVGITEIRYTARDESNNTRTATQLVTVVDDTPPVLARPNDIARNSDPGSCDAAVTFTAAASDNSPGVRVTFSPPSGSRFPVGASTVSCTATDAAGNRTATSFTVTVTNPAPLPAITGPATGTLVPTGSPVSFTGSFTDNAGDAHSVQWLLDSFGVPGTVNETLGLVSGSYAFPAAGVYLVQLPVTDGCGGSATAAQIGRIDEMIVVFDPRAEFVAGGGRFDSPAGALTADPAREGDAGFGFVSKTRRAMTGPTGNAEFYFQLGSFRFHASSFDALTISDGTALYRGTGTVNGAGSFGFVLSAVDGQEFNDVDRIRLRITNSAGNVVYDNEPGSDLTAPAGTEISAGAIEVHASRRIASTRAFDANTESAGSPAAAVPVAYALPPSFPNPFEGSTGLRFDLPQPSAVSLTVYDVLGREVASLVHEDLPAGSHQRIWNARGGRAGPVPAGVYVVRMVATPLAGGSTFTTKRKLVLLP